LTEIKREAGATPGRMMPERGGAVALEGWPRPAFLL
jgi:hypothetical protein